MHINVQQLTSDETIKKIKFDRLGKIIIIMITPFDIDAIGKNLFADFYQFPFRFRICFTNVISKYY